MELQMPILKFVYDQRIKRKSEDTATFAAQYNLKTFEQAYNLYVAKNKQVVTKCRALLLNGTPKAD